MKSALIAAVVAAVISAGAATATTSTARASQASPSYDRYKASAIRWVQRKTQHISGTCEYEGLGGGYGFYRAYFCMGVTYGNAQGPAYPCWKVFVRRNLTISRTIRGQYFCP